MRKLPLFAMCLITLYGGDTAAQDGGAIIANAQRALGNPTAVTYSGPARDVSFQQCGANVTQMTCGGMHDPMRPVNGYVRVIELAGPTSREKGTTHNVPGGPTTTAVPGTFFQQVTPQQADISQPWETSIEFYLTPWGFLKGAAATTPTATRRRLDGKNYTVLSWSPTVKAPSGKAYVIDAYLNDANLVERVETWLGNNIMGDMHIVATYSGWKDFGGVIAPTTIRQMRGGLPFFEVNVTAAKANPPDLASIAAPPAAPAAAAGGAPGGGRQGGPPPALTVTSEKLGDGLYRLTSGVGGYDSLIVEFKDHIMMIEAGQSEARAHAYVAETKKLIPNKPIRYVVNSHPHSDHSGGVPALVAEGATIVTHRNNAAYFERALNTPRTLLADTLARSPRKARIEAVGQKKVYSDGTRVVELHHVYPIPHTNGMLMAYVPKEKVLLTADFTLPPAGQPANDHHRALIPILNKLNLDFVRFVSVHSSAQPQTKADLLTAVGVSAAGR